MDNNFSIVILKPDIRLRSSIVMQQPDSLPQCFIISTKKKNQSLIVLQTWNMFGSELILCGCCGGMIISRYAVSEKRTSFNLIEGYNNIDTPQNLLRDVRR